MKRIIFAICCLCSSSVFAATYTDGNTIAAVHLQNQFEQPANVTAQTKVILFSRSMKGGDIIKDALEKLGKDNQPADLVYVADISAMPSLISKFVAIPQMKDLPFAIALDTEGKQTADFPAKDDQATLIRLDNFNITAIEYFDSVASLTKAL
ncbi:hypothetical protein [Shewanella marina]|uniref:hypothetical protein n=1 Tax=Shewanella marina TaxID=487319 RepID=UPI00046F8AD1|nr:hypothetical protein [Shewanella marina]